VRGRVPLLAGTGLAGTRNTLTRTRRAREAGVDAALVVAPPYVRPTQEGLYRHYSAVADEAGVPVMLYNVPSRTACDLLPETVARLAAHGNILGIKEAVGDDARMRALLALQSERFRVFSGDDPTAARAMLAGAAGVVSVTANVAPRHMARLCAACTAGDEALAQALDRELQPLHALLGAEPNPIPLKWCLAQRGFGEDALRLPLVPLGAAHHARGVDVLARLGLVEAEPAVG
jgi:4-hydroxy-tetrahydrodipicolinate synthase